MRIIHLSIIFLIVSVGFSTNLAFGHGLGGETHPPVSLDGRDVTLSIDIAPSVFDKDDPQRYITLNLSESKNLSIVEHVTFVLEMTKDGEQIFRRTFHDDSGNLIIKVISDDSDKIKIEGDKSPAIEAWMKTATEPVTLTGPIFDSGGLYEYKVEILTADSDFNFLDKRLELIGAVSLAEHNTYEILDSQGNSNEVNIISYFDTIENFEFDSDKISFSMPFDWNQDFEQLSVVHEEVRISKEFSEFLHTKYEAKLNGIQLKDTDVTIDDYSVDGRTVHIVLNQKGLKEIREHAMQESSSQMFFELGPSNDAGLPLEAVTPDMKYRVFLSWKPEIIKAGEDVTLFLQTNELPEIKKENIEELEIKTTGTPADKYTPDEREQHCESSNAKTNQYIKEFKIPTPCTQPLSIIADSEGKIWFTESNTGNIALFDPESEEFTEYENDMWSLNSASMSWGIAYTEDNEIWFTDEKYGALWKFSIPDETYTKFEIQGKTKKS